MRTGQVFHIERCPPNPKLWAFLQWWAANGPFPIVVIFGFRTDAQQRALYAQGRTTPGKIVTDAPDGSKTAHGRYGAVDCQPVRDSAGDLVKLIYTGDEDDPIVRATANDLLDRYCQAVRDHGLVSGADFPNLIDKPHAQDPDWQSLPYPPPA